MAQPLPSFLPTSALSAPLDVFVAIAAASQAGFADARATFELTLPRLGKNVGFYVLAGVEPLIDTLEKLKLKNDDLTWLESAGMFDRTTFDRLASFRFLCSVDAPPEGTIVFPGESVLTVEGPYWQAQLVASLVRGSVGAATIAATRAARFAMAANGADVIEAASASAHRLGGNPLLARAAFVGGMSATTSALAARRYRIPVRVGMPLNYVLGAPDMERAIVAWARTMRDRPSLRIDARSPLTKMSAIVGALKKRGANQFAKGDVSIELTGGDLFEMARTTLEAFRAAGLPEPALLASGDLDEHAVAELVAKKCRYSGFVIDRFGCEDPSWLTHYDLVAIERDGQWAPRIRVGATVNESSDPGRKVVVRYVDREGAPICDVAHGTKERLASPSDVRFIERATGMPTALTAHASSPLSGPVMRDGRRVQVAEPARTIRERVMRAVKALPERFRRLSAPELYPVGATETLLETKHALLTQARGA